MGMTDEDYRMLAKLARNVNEFTALVGDLAKRMAYVESLLSTLRERGVRLSEWRRIHDEVDAIRDAGLMEEALKIADEMLAEQEKGKMN